MKKRIFAGLLLAFMLVFSAVPAFAEEVPAEEVVVEEAPAEEVPAEEAPAEEAPVEEAPAEVAEPELPKFVESKVLELTDASYDNANGTISFTYVNNSEMEANIAWIVMDFDTTKITVETDMQSILPASVAAQAGIEMEDGAIVLVNKVLDPGAKQSVKFKATVVDYKEGELPQVGLRVFLQEISNDIDLTVEKAANDLCVQKFDNIFVTAGAGNFVKDNLVLIIVIAVVLLAVIILLAVMMAKKKKVVVEDVAFAAPVAEDAQEVLEMEYAENQNVEGEKEDEEV